MGNKQPAKKNVDYDAVREDIKEMMSNPDWDDGSYAPTLIRLAWHSSGTFDANDSTGGSNGATMRHAVESSDPENVGLEKAREVLEPIKKKYPGISYSDLWILAAYVALEVTGGPVIEFNPCRSDKVSKFAIKPGRLPHAEEGLGQGLDEEGRINGWENLAQHIRDVFYRMGFNDREIVALISGGHLYGRCHPDKSGYAGAWVEAPTKFSNEFAADLVEDEWMCVEHDTKIDGEPIPEETRPAPGKRQYMTKWEPTKTESADTEKYPLGRYKVVPGWINIRRTHVAESYIIDQPVRDTEFNVVCIKQVGAGIRGQLDTGGWASLVTTDGSEVLMERTGEFDFSFEFPATYRVLNDDVLVYAKKPEGVKEEKKATKLTSKEVKITEIEVLKDGDKVFEIVGKLEGSEEWIVLGGAENASPLERIVKDYNETPRKSMKKMQVKYQMMLPSDMVLLWDEKFCVFLKEYAEDEELLKKEFGEAYKKLTELGCPGCPAVSAYKAE